MRKLILLLLLPVIAFAANPQLGFNELAANQAQPHITINTADRAITGMLAGQLTFNMLTNGNLTLANTQWQFGTIRITDTGPVLTTGRDIIYPNVDSYTGGTSRATFYFVNSTAQTLTVKRSGQTGVAVTPGSAALLHHNGTDIEAVSSASGSGDASTNTATSVDSELTLFSGTGGKTLKRATGTGIAKMTSGVLSAATAGTDYYAPSGTDVAFADGGTGLSSASDDQTLVSSGSAWVAKTIPDCTDTGGNHINYTQSTNAFSCGTSGGGGGGSPGGSNTQVQFNDSAAFGGDAGFVWNKTTNVLTLGESGVPATITAPATTELVLRASTGGSTQTGGITYVIGGTGGSGGTGGALVLAGGVTGGGGNDGTVFIKTGGIAGTNRLNIEPDGSFNIAGSNGTAGYVLSSEAAATSPIWRHPTINPYQKHQRITTGSVSAGSSALVTLTWAAAFASSSYTVTCDVEDATTAALALQVVHIESKTGSAITVRVNNSSAGSLTGTLGCIAMLD